MASPKGYNESSDESVGASLIDLLVNNLPAMQETPGSIPGSGRSAGEGIGYPLQYLGLPLWLSW